MFSKKKIIKSMQTYSEKIDSATALINQAEKIVLGIGSGLSAAGGLCYTDPKLTQKWYPEYYSMGLQKIVDIQGAYWWLHNSKPEEYWGFWARHIWHIRYETDATNPYKDLFSLIGDKEYFVCTTNVDSQAEKAGFAANRILAPQGNYCYFQCSKPCSDEVYYNEEMITCMVNNMVSPFEIRTEDIPICPRCGISADMFARLTSKTEQRRMEIANKIVSAEITAKEAKAKHENIQRWVQLIKEKATLEDVDRDLLETLIERVEVGKKIVENGVKSQEVKIIYKFVGAV